jgi:hypothetical protein
VAIPRWWGVDLSTKAADPSLLFHFTHNATSQWTRLHSTTISLHMHLSRAWCGSVVTLPWLIVTLTCPG